MATYLCVKVSSGTAKFKAKSTTEAGRPYLRVHGVYFPLTTETATGPQIKIQRDNQTYRIVQSYTTSQQITVTTGTSYHTQQSTYTTTYDTQKSTYTTTYDTRKSTYSTSYLTQPVTYSTVYETSRRLQPLNDMHAYGKGNVFIVSLADRNNSYTGAFDYSVQATARADFATMFPPLLTSNNDYVDLSLDLQIPGFSQSTTQFNMNMDIGSVRYGVSSSTFGFQRRYVHTLQRIGLKHTQRVSYTDEHPIFTYSSKYEFEFDVPFTASSSHVTTIHPAPMSTTYSTTFREFDYNKSTHVFGQVWETIDDSWDTIDYSKPLVINVLWEDAIYATQTTNTRYLTQSSTYDTSYVTKSSTYNTRYLTRSSTYRTRYLTQSSTYSTEYLTTTSSEQTTSE